MDFYRPQYSIPREGEIESPSSISQKTTEFAQNNFDIIMSRHIGQNNDLEFISLPNNVDYQIYQHCLDSIKHSDYMFRTGQINQFTYSQYLFSNVITATTLLDNKYKLRVIGYANDWPRYIETLLVQYFPNWFEKDKPNYIMDYIVKKSASACMPRLVNLFDSSTFIPSPSSSSITPQALLGVANYLTSIACETSIQHVRSVMIDNLYELRPTMMMLYYDFEVSNDKIASFWMQLETYWKHLLDEIISDMKGYIDQQSRLIRSLIA